MIDIHTHIFPELDDGSNSVQNSIAMLREEALQGVKGVFLTPHYRRCYMPSAEQVKSRFEDFCKIAKQEGINLELFLGQEIYFLKADCNILKENKVLTLNNTKCVLCEFDFYESIDQPDEVVYELVRNGYKPIVAHVERYSYLKIEDIMELKKLGALLQINADSLFRGRFNSCALKTKKLLKLNLVDFVASDYHFSRKNQMKKAYNYISKKFGIDMAEKLFKINAEKFLLNR